MRRAVPVTAVVLLAGVLSACGSGARSGAAAPPSATITPTTDTAGSSPIPSAGIPSPTSDQSGAETPAASASPSTDTSGSSGPAASASPQDVIAKIGCITPDAGDGMPASAASNFEDLFQAIGQGLVARSAACYIDDGAFKDNPVMVVQVEPGHTPSDLISAVTGAQLSYWPLSPPGGGDCVIITQTDAVHAAILQRLNSP